MASNAIKRQRKKRRVDTDGDPEFQVAPMVDVLLVLMLFFMAITSTEVLKKDPNLQLADAKNGKKDTKTVKHQIEVNIGWDNKNNAALFSMDGVNFPSGTDQNLQNAIAARKAKDPQGYVLVRADKNTEYSNVADLMSTCAAAGVGTVTFAVLLGNGDNKPAAPEAAPTN